MCLVLQAGTGTGTYTAIDIDGYFYKYSLKRLACLVNIRTVAAAAGELANRIFHALAGVSMSNLTAQLIHVARAQASCLVGNLQLKWWAA